MNLLETSIIIDIMENNNYTPAIISPRTLLEVLRGNRRQEETPSEAVVGRKLHHFKHRQQHNREAYCKIQRKLEQECNLFPDADLLIAATAIAHDLTLETKDTHFLRLKSLGLKLA